MGAVSVGGVGDLCLGVVVLRELRKGGGKLGRMYVLYVGIHSTHFQRVTISVAV